MAGHGGLEAAAQRRAVDGRDDGHLAGLDGPQYGRQPGIGRRLAEFTDVGAREERTAGTRQENRLAAGSARFGKTALEPHSNGMRKCIDRRVVGRDDGEFSIEFDTYRIGHVRAPAGFDMRDQISISGAGRWYPDPPD